MSRHKDCLELFEHLSELIDGELDRVTGEQIRAHIEGCPQCRVCWATLQKSVEICKHLGPEPIPPGLVDDIKAFIRTNME